LKEGEEATVSYVDVEGVEAAQRTKELEERWFFECACGRCLRELGRLGPQSSSPRGVVGDSGSGAVTKVTQHFAG